MRHPPQAFPGPVYDNSQWSTHDSKSGYVDTDSVHHLADQLSDSSTPAALTSVATVDSRRPSAVKIEDDFPPTNTPGWHERPHGFVPMGPVRHFSHPTMPLINTNTRSNDFNCAPTYASMPTWPISAHTDPPVPTSVFGPMHDGFGAPPHFPIGGPITFTGYPTDPNSAITMSPQSSQGGWHSGASSDGTERPIPLQSPLGRALSPTSVLRPDGIRKKNARFDIPKDRNLNNIDDLIQRSTNEQEKKELKQQKRLLRNRQAALDSRQRKKTHTEKLEQEKREFISKEAELTDQLNQQIMGLGAERDEWLQQRQDYEACIQNLLLERDEAIRARTLETAELRRQNNYLKDMVRDLQRQSVRGHATPSTDAFTDFHDFNNLGIEDTWEEGEYGFISRDDMRLDMDDPYHRQATPRPASAPAPVTDPKSMDAKSEAGFSWNTFYMCLLFGAFIAANSGTKSNDGSVSTSLTTSAIPALSDDYRAEAGNVLKAVLGSTGAGAQMPAFEHVHSMTTGGELATASIPPGPSRLESLHASLTTPSRHQQQIAAFGLSASAYSHVANPEGFYDIDSSVDDYAESKPSRLEQMLANMQAERDGIDKMTGLGGRARERSLLLGNVPEKVLREFRALVGMTEQMNLQ